MPAIESTVYSDAPSPVLQRLEHLRSQTIRKNLRLRHRIRQSAAVYLSANEFLEIDTPTLGPRVDEYAAGHISATTGDGSELWLAQSPQLYKQMFMASGYQRYFQFAHCFRDDYRPPGRTDYLREFVQLDIELETRLAADVRRLIEQLLVVLLADLGVEVRTPFLEIDAVECVDTYGTDCPDLSTDANDLAFIWVTDFPLVETGSNGAPKLNRHPMAMPVTMPGSFDEAVSVRTQSYDLVLNGYEIASGDLRIHDAGDQRQVLEVMGIEPASFEDLLAVLDGGCPPHGGAGIGLDRLVMRLAGSHSVADACALPDLFGY